MNTPKFRKHQIGQSGAFTEQYHQLLGSTPWIVVKRLLCRELKPHIAADPASISNSEISPERDATELSEGDIVTVFSQFGKVEDVRFIRHRKTGRFLGTAYLKYDDYRSSIVAANEMNSHFESDDLVVLTAGKNQAGIIVERCEESEVPLGRILRPCCE